MSQVKGVRLAPRIECNTPADSAWAVAHGRAYGIVAAHDQMVEDGDTRPGPLERGDTLGSVPVAAILRALEREDAWRQRSEALEAWCEQLERVLRAVDAGGCIAATLSGLVTGTALKPDDADEIIGVLERVHNGPPQMISTIANDDGYEIRIRSFANFVHTAPGFNMVGLFPDAEPDSDPDAVE